MGGTAPWGLSRGGDQMVAQEQLVSSRMNIGRSCSLVTVLDGRMRDYKDIGKPDYICGLLLT